MNIGVVLTASIINYPPLFEALYRRFYFSISFAHLDVVITAKRSIDLCSGQSWAFGLSAMTLRYFCFKNIECFAFGLRVANPFANGLSD